jgi:SAM-dependent methyltransferase
LNTHANLQEIPFEEINFHSLSYCDERGRLFWWKEQLYRGIAEPYLPFYKELFTSGIIRRFVEKGFLVETELTDYVVSEYPLVVRHRRIPFVSYANEWCPAMLRDTGYFLLDLTAELLNNGLLLTSANSWSVLFDGCQPLLIDFCDIVSLADKQNTHWRRFRAEYYTDFIYPLQLMAKGRGHLARWILADYERQEIHRQFAEVMGYRNGQPPSAVWSSIRSLARRVLPAAIRRAVRRWKASAKAGYTSTHERNAVFRGVQELRRKVERIPFLENDCAKGPENENHASFAPTEEWSEKQRQVHAMLGELEPRTVLDIGCGTGWYAQLAASLGANVVGIDKDERKVDECYRKSRERKLSVHPLVMDIRYPTPGYGIANATLPPATQRLACEMVLALGLVHHLVLEQVRTLEQIAEAIASFSKRWALVEFASVEDGEVAPWLSTVGTWYSLGAWRKELEKWFRILRVVPSHPGSRVLILCEKNNQ